MLEIGIGDVNYMNWQDIVRACKAIIPIKTKDVKDRRQFKSFVQNDSGLRMGVKRRLHLGVGKQEGVLRSKN